MYIYIYHIYKGLSSQNLRPGWKSGTNLSAEMFHEGCFYKQIRPSKPWLRHKIVVV